MKFYQALWRLGTKPLTGNVHLSTTSVSPVAHFQQGNPTPSIGQATPPAGSFVSVSAGQDHTCGVRSDGSVACWGLYTRGLTASDFSR